MIDREQFERIADFLANELGPDHDIVVLVVSKDDQGTLREMICTHDSEDDACEDMLAYLESDVEDIEIDTEQQDSEMPTRTLQ
jgi:hypothetical protein